MGSISPHRATIYRTRAICPSSPWSLPLCLTLCAPAVNDNRMRSRFAAAVETPDLVVRLGPWKQSEQQPRPPWTSLQRARVWKDAKFAALRQLLAAPPRPPVLSTSPDAAHRSIVMTDDGAGHPGGTVVMYKAKGAVPDEMLQRRIRLVVVHAAPNTRMSPGSHPLRIRWSQGVWKWIQRGVGRHRRSVASRWGESSHERQP